MACCVVFHKAREGANERETEGGLPVKEKGKGGMALAAEARCRPPGLGGKAAVLGWAAAAKR